MKNLFLIALFFISVKAQASYQCSLFFDTVDIQEHEIETQNGKPRYFTVKNYGHLKGKELDTYLTSIRNLTQFSESLEQVSTFIPETSLVPSEAFFIANKLVPLIEDFLNAHDVKYRIETYEESEESRAKRSLIVISSDVGTNGLNALATKLWTQEKILLVVNPIDLFYGYEHYNEIKGKFFDIDSYTPAYEMSFHLLLHSQRKDFDVMMSDLSKNDFELQKMRSGEPFDAQEAKIRQKKYDDGFKESRKRAADHMNELIRKAQEQKEKGSSVN